MEKEGIKERREDINRIWGGTDNVKPRIDEKLNLILDILEEKAE